MTATGGTQIPITTAIIIMMIIIIESCYISVNSSVQSLDRQGRRGDMRDDLAEVLFQSCLQKALVSSSGMSRIVYSLMLSILHFLCRPRRSPPFRVP